ncbi:MAG: hypothetical protein K9I48_06055 [Sphingobacteriales bacterium]|nr:hypothetical protein [Sphingobacteriales bacterium]
MKKIYASSIYFVLIISLIVFILLGSLIGFVYYNKQYLITYVHEKKVFDNIRFAEELYLKDERFREQVALNSTFDLFFTGNDSVSIETEKWGLYNHIKVEAWSLHARKSSDFLSASDMSRNDTMQAVLYLKDLQNLLALAGDTKIEGVVYLPEAGVKPIIMLGKPYQHKQLIFGKINKSTKDLPKVDSMFFKYISQLFDTVYLKETYRKNNTKLVEGSIIKKLFSDSADLYISKAKINLNDILVKGHIVIFSTEEIIVTSNARLSDVILIAPIIRFEKNFSGSVQAFAKDSLVVSKGAKLIYPSILCTYTTKENDSEILIKNGSMVNGTIIGLDDTIEDKNVKVTIEENTKIKGLIWSEGYLQLKSNVLGSVFTHKLLWNTNSTIYENHLLNINLNTINKAEKFLLPLIFPSLEINILKRVK